MATKYVKGFLNIIQSDYSDYSRALPVIEVAPTATPDEAVLFNVEAVTGGGTTLDLGMFDTITGLVIVNDDSTNYLDATWTYSATSSKAKCLAGHFIRIGEVTVANDLLLVANTATVACRVYVWGT